MMANLNEAIIFAVQVHAGQIRKGTDNIPYIIHPMKVMTYLTEMNVADTELLCAGVLHDTVEDTGVTIEELAIKFGKHVAELVGAHSENKSLPWRTRKEIDLAKLAKGPRDLQMMVLADKLANSSDTLRDYKKIGDKVWERFNKGKNDQKWYYEESVEALAALDGDPDAGAHYQKFKEIVAELFGKLPKRLKRKRLIDQWREESISVYWEGTRQEFEKENDLTLIRQDGDFYVYCYPEGDIVTYDDETKEYSSRVQNFED